MVASYDSTFGVNLIGGYMTAVLYGIFCLQCHIFFCRFQQEKPLLKYSIVVLWILNTLHLILIVHFSYWYMVTNFSNVLVLGQQRPWSIPLFGVVTPTANLLVKFWLVKRVWILSGRNRALMVFLVLAIVVTWGFGIAFSVELFILPTFESYSKENWLYYTEFTIEAFTDLTIATTLCWFLLRRRTRTTFKPTYSVINFVLVYTVNTGLVTSVLCLASIFARIVQPDNFYFFAIYMILSGSYSNALLGSLNARDWFRQDKPVINIPLSNWSHSDQPARSRESQTSLHANDHAQREGQLPIQVDTEVIKAEL